MVDLVQGRGVSFRDGKTSLRSPSAEVTAFLESILDAMACGQDHQNKIP